MWEEEPKKALEGWKVLMHYIPVGVIACTDVARILRVLAPLRTQANPFPSFRFVLVLERGKIDTEVK